MPQPPAQYRLVRPDDHLELRIIAERLTQFTRADGSRELVANRVDLFGKPVAGLLAIQIQPQHLIEWADAEAAPQPKPIFGDSTTVRFVVPAGGKVPLTVEGMLAAIRTLYINEPLPPQPGATPTEPTLSAAELVTRSIQTRAGEDPLLAERRRRADARLPALEPAVVEPPTDDSQGPVTPVQVSTQLHFPSRLVMNVLGSVGFDHAAQPANRDGRVELWHTRLNHRNPDGSLTEQPTSVYVGTTQELPDGFTSDWSKRVGDAKIKSALKKADRKNLAIQTFAKPVTAHRLALSAYGAWLDAEGEWPGQPLAAWEHKMIQGRDVYVRTAALGTLYPLGHTAMRVDITERVMPKRNGQPAVLKTTNTIIVRQRDKSFPATDPIGRAWPWASVRILTRSVTGFAETVVGSAALMMAGPGNPFQYECVGTDRGGRVSTFEMPLYFVPDGFTQLGDLENIYVTGNAKGHGGESFRTVTLTGQTVSVAPVVPGAADAGDVVVDSIRLAPPSKVVPGAAPAPRPAVERIVGSIPALEQLVPSASGAPAVVKFAGPYLTGGFAANANPGEALLELIPQNRPLLDFADKALTGGLIGPKYELTALSRKFGPVGGSVSDLANGQFDPAKLFGDFIGQIKLLGVFPLRDLIGADTLQPMADAPRLTSTALDGIASPGLTWQTNLFKTKSALEVGVLPAKGTLQPRRQDGQALTATLTMTAETTVDKPTGSMRHRTRCEIRDIELVFSMQDEDLLVVPIRNITFESRDGGKIDVDVNLGAVQFLGVLAFIRTLADLIPSDGFHDPPALDVRPDGVTSSFSLPLPPVSAGVFVLENIALSSQLELFFAGDAPTFEVGFARAESPFRVTVAALGGGGWVGVKVATDGLRHLAGALEFGAAVAVDLGVARGSVSAMGGLSFFVDGDGFARLTAYFTVRGELRVLGLISISVEVTLALGYESPPARLYGRAELCVKVKLLFVSKSVKVTFEKTFAGADPAPGARALGQAGPPTFADLMGGGDPGKRPWDTYCLTYAED